MQFGILGAGTWGMALARMISNMGHSVTVWSALPTEIESLSEARHHPNLPGMVIPDSVMFSKSIQSACKNKDMLMFAVPSVYVRSTVEQAREYMSAM